MYNLLSRIYYPEIAGMFGRLDETFESIVENIRLVLPNEPTDEDILAQIEKQADEWDQLIAQNPKNGGTACPGVRFVEPFKFRSYYNSLN